MSCPYPEYRDSGVAWLGDVPKHWGVTRLKFVARLNPTASNARKLDPDTEVSFVPMEAVGEYGGLDLSNIARLSDVAEGYTYFGDRDVVVAKITPCFENWKGALATGLVNGVAFGTTELHVLRCGGRVDERFLLYLTFSYAFRSLGTAEMSGAAGQKRVPASFLDNLTPAIPSLDEQRAIAAFLDRETQRIDALVEKKRRLIERLQEYCTALITRTVTRGLPPEAARTAGLDPSPRLKPSGADWLGDVPENWEVLPFQRVLQEPLQYGANEAAELDDPSLPRFVRITDIDRTGRLRDDTFRSLPVDVAEPYILLVGDLLFARSGATVGRTFLYDATSGTCAYAGYLIRARVNRSKAEPKYIWYFSGTKSYMNWLRAVQIQATIQNVSAERYSRMPIPLPAVAEQKAIVTHLDYETGRIDELLGRVECNIERLREYRTALITAAVTGKIDVRDAAPEPAAATA